MKEYKPKKSEIFREIVSEIRKSPRDLTSRIGKSSKEFGKFTVKAGKEIFYYLHLFPMVKRSWMEAGKSPSFGDLTSAQLLGGVVGILGSAIGQIAGYGYLATHDHPEVLLIPATTNILSGIYELGRPAYISARERLIEKHNRENHDDSPRVPRF